jgi:hypothetical protein
MTCPILSWPANLDPSCRQTNRPYEKNGLMSQEHVFPDVATSSLSRIRHPTSPYETGSKMRVRRFHFCHPISIAFPDTGRGCWDLIRGGENADFGVPALSAIQCVYFLPIEAKFIVLFPLAVSLLCCILGISLVAD